MADKYVVDTRPRNQPGGYSRDGDEIAAESVIQKNTWSPGTQITAKAMKQIEDQLEILTDRDPNTIVFDKEQELDAIQKLRSRNNIDAAGKEIIRVQSTTPTVDDWNEGTKVWINTETADEIEIPTAEDVDKLIVVSETRPTTEETKIWIDTDSTTTIQIPTYEEYEDGLKDVVRYSDQTDALTQLSQATGKDTAELQKLARDNIGAAGEAEVNEWVTGVVKYNVDQRLEPEDQKQARDNIGAMSVDEVVSTKANQGLNSTLQANARDNIGLSQVITNVTIDSENVVTITNINDDNTTFSIENKLPNDLLTKIEVNEESNQLVITYKDDSTTAIDLPEGLSFDGGKFEYDENTDKYYLYLTKDNNNLSSDDFSPIQLPEFQTLPFVTGRVQEETDLEGNTKYMLYLIDKNNNELDQNIFQPFELPAGGGGGVLAYSIRVFAQRTSLTMAYGQPANIKFKYIEYFGGQIQEGSEGNFSIQYKVTGMTDWVNYTLENENTIIVSNTEKTINVTNLLVKNKTVYIRITCNNGKEEENFASNSCTFTINSLDISIENLFNFSSTYKGIIPFEYRCTGLNITKILHFFINGQELNLNGKENIGTSNGKIETLPINMSSYGYGAYSAKVYFTTPEGATSNILHFPILYDDEQGAQIPMIGAYLDNEAITILDSLNLHYICDTPLSNVVDNVIITVYKGRDQDKVKIYETEQESIINNQIQDIIISDLFIDEVEDITGLIELRCISKNQEVTQLIEFSVSATTGTDYNLGQVIDSLIYSYKPSNFTNNDKDKNIYRYKTKDAASHDVTIFTTFKNLNWITDGYLGDGALTLAGSDIMEIELPIISKMFQQEQRPLSQIEGTQQEGETNSTYEGGQLVELINTSNSTVITAGRTIEFDLMFSNVTNPGTSIISYLGTENDYNSGFEITPQVCYLLANNQTIEFDDSIYRNFVLNEGNVACAYLTEGKRLRISFVIEKSDIQNNKECGCIKIYINGQYANTYPYGINTFDTINPDTKDIFPLIKIGSKDCITKIYDIKIYTKGLTDKQILQNYMNSSITVEEKIKNHEDNDVLNSSNTSILYRKAIYKYPCLLIIGQLPDLKSEGKLPTGLKLTKPINEEANFSEEFNLLDFDYDIEYDPSSQESTSSNTIVPKFLSTTAVQGTSSQKYLRKNFKITLIKGVKDGNGNYEYSNINTKKIATKKIKYSIDGYNNKGEALSTPENKLCFKMDYMSSDHANTFNGNLADKLFNEPNNQNTVHGFRCLLFNMSKDDYLIAKNAIIQENITNANISGYIEKDPNNFLDSRYEDLIHFAGDGCLNNDKSNADSFGLTTENDKNSHTTQQKWEFKNNTSLICSFKSDNFFGKNSQGQLFAREALESCYPDEGDLDDLGVNPDYFHIQLLFSWVYQRANYWQYANSCTGSNDTDAILSFTYGKEWNFLHPEVSAVDKIRTYEYTIKDGQYYFKLNENLNTIIEKTGPVTDESMEISYTDSKLNRPIIFNIPLTTFIYDDNNFKAKKNIFKNEFYKHFNLEHAIIYYLFIEWTALCDNRAKNLFLRSTDITQDNNVKFYSGNNNNSFTLDLDVFNNSLSNEHSSIKEFIDTYYTNPSKNFDDFLKSYHETVLNTLNLIDENSVRNNYENIYAFITTEHSSAIVKDFVDFYYKNHLADGNFDSFFTTYNSISLDEFTDFDDIISKFKLKFFVDIETGEVDISKIDWNNSTFSIWYTDLYDLDSCYGVENTGKMSIPYYADWYYINEGRYQFAGAFSPFWNMFEESFAEEIKAKAQALTSASASSLGNLKYSNFKKYQITDNAELVCPTIINEDMQYKYLDTIKGYWSYDPDTNTSTKVTGTDYVYLARGSRIEQKNNFMQKRITMLTSKYVCAPFLDNCVSFRSSINDDHTLILTPDQAMWLGVKFGDSNLNNPPIMSPNKINPGEEWRCTGHIGGTDTIYIYGANNITRIDGLAHFQPFNFDKLNICTKLKSLIMGSQEPNQNDNPIDLSGCVVLETLNLQNYTNTREGLDLKNNKLIKHVYVRGSTIQTINLFPGGVLETLELASPKSIDLENQLFFKEPYRDETYQNSSTGLTWDNLNNLTQLIIINTPNIPIEEILISRLEQLTNGMKLNDINVTFSSKNSNLLLTKLIDPSIMFGKKLIESADTNGNIVYIRDENAPYPDITGVINCTNVGAAIVARMKECYPNNLQINATNVFPQYRVKFILYIDENYEPVYAMNNGEIYTQYIITGEKIINPYISIENHIIDKPTRPNTQSSHFEFSGWRFYDGGEAASNLFNFNQTIIVENDLIGYKDYYLIADYIELPRFYTVTWYKSNEETEDNKIKEEQVEYGHSVKYVDSSGRAYISYDDRNAIVPEDEINEPTDPNSEPDISDLEPETPEDEPTNDDDDNENDNPTIEDETFCVQKPVIPPEPSHNSNEYYTFLGWDNYTGNVTNNINVHARWSIGTLPDMTNKTMDDLNPGQMKALFSNKQFLESERGIQQNDGFSFYIGVNPEYENVEEITLINNNEPRYFSGTENDVFIPTDKNGNPIKLFAENSPSFTLLLDYQFNNDYTNETNGATLVSGSCEAIRNTSGNYTIRDGFTLYSRMRIQPTTTTTSQYDYSEIELGNDTAYAGVTSHGGTSRGRHILVIRHRKGSISLEVAGDYNTWRYFMPNRLNVNPIKCITQSNDEPLCFGARRLGENQYDRYAKGWIYFAKIWFEYFDNDTAEQISLWPHEKITMFYTGKDAYKYKYINSDTHCIANFCSRSSLYVTAQPSQSNNTEEGWRGCFIRQIVLPRIYNALPIWLQSLIKPVEIITNRPRKLDDPKEIANNIYLRRKTFDLLYLLSEFEVSTITSADGLRLYAPEDVNISYNSILPEIFNKSFWSGITLPSIENQKTFISNDDPSSKNNLISYWDLWKMDSTRIRASATGTTYTFNGYLYYMPREEVQKYGVINGDRLEPPFDANDIGYLSRIPTVYWSSVTQRCIRLHNEYPVNSSGEWIREKTGLWVPARAIWLRNPTFYTGNTDSYINRWRFLEVNGTTNYTAPTTYLGVVFCFSV